MARQQPAVLMVSADHSITAAVEEMLDGFVERLDTVGSARTATTALSLSEYELAIVDASNDGLAALGALRQLRRATHLPVLVLAPNSSDAVARCLELGAEDCVRWPTSARELRARVQLRSVPRSPQRSVLRAGDLTIDATQRTVQRNDVDIALTDREFDLLVHLVTAGEPVTTDQLLAAVWSSSREWQCSSTVAEHVYRLRRKLEQDPKNPEWIVTVRGRGYQFVA